MSLLQLLKHSSKIIFLGLLDALSIYAGIVLYLDSSYVLLILLITGIAPLNYLLLSRRAYPLRYLYPGLVFLTAMVVYPIIYTVYIAFTNLGTGHLLNETQVIHLLEGRNYLPPDAQSLYFWAYADGRGNLRVILRTPEGEYLLSQGSKLQKIDSHAAEFIDENGDGVIDRFDSYHLLTRRELFQNLSQLEQLQFNYKGSILKLASTTIFKTYKQKYKYDPATATLIDLETGKRYQPIEGTFTAADGSTLDPGFRAPVGWSNFVQLLTKSDYRWPFVRVFIWTILWATFSVTLSFAVGLGFAILINDPFIRGRLLYRSLLIVPYAIPAFISALVWKGMFQADFGIINRTLYDLFHFKIPWLTDPFWAKVTLIFINIWLTYPYMMIVSLGALQSIPGEIYEAARVDGANGWQRFWQITMPLLMVSVAPLLIGSFAFTFNNFTLIWLVTAGRPAVPGSAVPAGATDILISFAYRLAFEGQRGLRLGLAAAVSIIIFIIIAFISWLNFRHTRVLEEVSEGV